MLGRFLKFIFEKIILYLDKVYSFGIFRPTSPSISVYKPTLYAFYSIIVRVTGILVFVGFIFITLLITFYSVGDFYFIYCSLLEKKFFFFYDCMKGLEYLLRVFSFMSMDFLICFTVILLLLHLIMGFKHVFNVRVLNKFEDYFFSNFVEKWIVIREFLKLDRFFIFLCFCTFNLVLLYVFLV